MSISTVKLGGVVAEYVAAVDPAWPLRRRV
jgi:hypothetical protein